MEWIDVNERLPEKTDVLNTISDKVLIAFGQTIIFGYYNGKEWLDSSMDIIKCKKSIGYWMPIPMPPEMLIRSFKKKPLANKTTFHERLKSFRLSEGMSQKDFAFAIGLQTRELQALESGEVYPTKMQLEILKMKFENLSISWLLSGE